MVSVILVSEVNPNNSGKNKKDSKFIPNVKISVRDVLWLHPKVSFSWKENVESVIKWMKEHMEAFKETHDGFLVDFIDDSWEKWYEVVPDSVTDLENVEAKVVISWERYVILKHTFSKSEYEMYRKFENWWKGKKSGGKEPTSENLLKCLEDWETVGIEKNIHLMNLTDLTLGEKKLEMKEMIYLNNWINFMQGEMRKKVIKRSNKLLCWVKISRMRDFFGVRKTDEY